jgi:hypothetical protein
MKRRPRRIEQMVAERLTSHFATMNMSPVERIPVLGRTGPDITINESKLAIDVKSRQAVPICNYAVRNGKIQEDPLGLLFVKLKDFPLIYSDDLSTSKLLSPSVAVREWLDHMAEWSRGDDQGNSVPAIVIHRPGTWVDSAVFVIYAGDRLRLKEIYKSWQDDSSKNSLK